MFHVVRAMVIAVCLSATLPAQGDEDVAPKAAASADIAQRIETGRLALIRMHSKSLESPLWVRRCFGVQGLSDVQHPAAVDRLVQALDDSDSRVVALTLLELVVRADELPLAAADAIGRAVKRLVTDETRLRGTYFAMLAAERLPAAPDAYRPVWQRAYARLRNPEAQSELATTLVNVVRARSDTALVDHVIERARGRSLSRRSRDAQFLQGLLGTTPGAYRTWPAWWAAHRGTYRFEPPVPTAFSQAVDAYVDARRNRQEPEHGTPEYFAQFEVFLGKLYASGLDVAFVFDSTGSMQPFIDEVKENIRIMAELLTSVTQETRVGLVTYRDRGDEYLTFRTPLTENTNVLADWMDGRRAAGGGDAPEAVLAALVTTLEKYDWRRDARRIITVIGDAPPHKEDRPALHTLCKKAKEDGFVINTIALVPDDFAERPAGATTIPTKTINLQALGTTLTFEEVARFGGGRAVVQNDTAQVVADMLKMAFGSDWEHEVDRFVEAYLLFASSDSTLQRARRARDAHARILERLGESR